MCLGKPDGPQNLTYLANMYINGEGGTFRQDVNFKNAGVDNTITVKYLTSKINRNYSYNHTIQHKSDTLQ